MKTIRVLGHKAKWGDKKLIDNLISIWTWSKYSHVEIWTPDEKDRVYSPPAFTEHYTEMGGLPTELIIYGTCYTSTMRGDDNGTVKRPASEVLDHPERWDYIEIEVTDEQYASLMTWMNFAVGINKGYAMWDILKFISPIHFNDKGRNICSEFVNNGLAAIGIFEKWGIVSPKKVFKKLIALGYEVKPLKG